MFVDYGLMYIIRLNRTWMICEYFNSQLLFILFQQSGYDIYIQLYLVNYVVVFL